MKKETPVIQITNSCGSQGCELLPYIMPYGIVKIAA